MKRTLFLTLAVLVLCISVCTVGTRFLGNILDRADRLRSEAIIAVEENNPDYAMEIMVKLAELWKQNTPIMEVLTSHDALHDVESGIMEAQICLECDDHDDFLRTISIVGAGMDHLNDVEHISLSNLY